MLSLEIVNDGTGNEDVGHYNYFVLINGRIIGSGRLEDFDKSKGHEALIFEIGKSLCASKRVGNASF